MLTAEAVLLPDSEEAERVEVTVATGREVVERVEVEEGRVLVLDAIEEEATMLVVEVTKEEVEMNDEETAEEDSTEEETLAELMIDELTIDELTTDDELSTVVAEEEMAEEVAVVLMEWRRVSDGTEAKSPSWRSVGGGKTHETALGVAATSRAETVTQLEEAPAA